MTPSSEGWASQPESLTSYQLELIDLVLAPDCEPIVLLRSKPGLGKTTALVALVGRLLREKPGARVLVLCPAALKSEWAGKLQDQHTACIVIDRYKFRERIDHGYEMELWPDSTASILSDDFAKQDDIAASLANVKWDLIIVEEAHRSVAKQRASLRNHLEPSADRVVLVSQGAAFEDESWEKSAKVIEWNTDDAFRYADHRGGEGSYPILSELKFGLSEDERRLWYGVQVLYDSLTKERGSDTVTAEMLHRSFCSSPVSLESVLRGLLAREAGGSAIRGGGMAESGDSYVARDQRKLVEELLDAIETIGTDSKLSAFDSLMNQFTSRNHVAAKVCIVTEYVSTLYYLVAEVERLGRVCRMLHRELPYERRREALHAVSLQEGILVATQQTMEEGLDLRFVTDLVLYDLPNNDFSLELLLGRFNRVGRSSRLHIHALVNTDLRDDVLREPLNRLRRALIDV